MCEKTKQLGQLMRATRKAKKLSVREVSELTGIHSGAITKFELGVTDMSISRVFKISEVLGLSLAEVSPENIEMLESIEELKKNVSETQLEKQKLDFTVYKLQRQIVDLGANPIIY
jgi:transcriptional regulator with XRE-family HTH domain